MRGSNSIMFVIFQKKTVVGIVQPRDPEPPVQRAGGHPGQTLQIPDKAENPGLVAEQDWSSGKRGFHRIKGTYSYVREFD